MTSANNAVKRRAFMLATAERRIRDITRLEQTVPGLFYVRKHNDL